MLTKSDSGIGGFPIACSFVPLFLCSFASSASRSRGHSTFRSRRSRGVPGDTALSGVPGDTARLCVPGGTALLDERVSAPMQSQSENRCRTPGLVYGGNLPLTLHVPAFPGRWSRGHGGPGVVRGHSICLVVRGHSNCSGAITGSHAVSVGKSLRHS